MNDDLMENQFSLFTIGSYKRNLPRNSKIGIIIENKEKVKQEFNNYFTPNENFSIIDVPVEKLLGPGEDITQYDLLLNVYLHDPQVVVTELKNRYYPLANRIEICGIKEKMEMYLE